MKTYRNFMKAFGFLYAVGAVVFLFLPQPLFDLMNQVPQRFGILSALPPASEFFWLPLATSMMVMLSTLSFLAAASPHQRGYPLTILISKLSSTTGFALFLFIHRPYFAYLLGVLTDLPIALVLGYFMFHLRPQTLGSENGMGKATNYQ